MIIEWNGQECEVKVRRTKYRDGSLYVFLLDERDNYFLSLSSNTYYSQFLTEENQAYLSGYNVSEYDKFIVQNHLGKFTGTVKRLGAFKFYLYEFDMDNIPEEKLEKNSIMGTIYEVYTS